MNSGYHNKLQESLSHEAIARALFENYEVLYAVDIKTSAFQCFHESDSFSTLRLDNCGDDFFAAVRSSLARVIYPDDQEYVRHMLSKEAVLKGIERDKYYSFVYRIVIDGKPLYHKFRATMDVVNDRPHLLIGVRNIDDTFRLEKAHADRLSAMQSKEINHLEAVLASAEGYLEVNLTRNQMLEISPYQLPEGLPSDWRFPTMQDQLTYNEFETWLMDHLVVGNKEKYREASDRNYLIRCFQNGVPRVTVDFSSASVGEPQPSKKVFYLYQDENTRDVLAFCVIYDLTEQQRKEKELQDLEHQLQMSRIRNFTSQMQPHFLYNALGSIQEVVLDDPQYASDLIGDFTVHLRSCIRAMANDAPIPFDQELANVKAYVNIERMRFGKKLNVVYDIQSRNFQILPLSVQPIVENAIRHGIYERGERGGTVRIHTEEQADQWVVTVQDDGVGFDMAKLNKDIAAGERDSTGLKNIMFRLDKVMNTSVNINSIMGEGTTVTIMVPKEAQSK